MPLGFELTFVEPIFCLVGPSLRGVALPRALFWEGLASVAAPALA